MMNTRRINCLTIVLILSCYILLTRSIKFQSPFSSLFKSKSDNYEIDDNNDIDEDEFDNDVEKPLRKNLLLPKLLPHKDTHYLLEFHSDNCDTCEQMEPVLQRLEEDIDAPIKRINIGHKKDYYSVLEAMGYDECGQLPFYYNRRTCQANCGATGYGNLKRWATGNEKHSFQDPPENLFENELDNMNRKEFNNNGMFLNKLLQSTNNKNKQSKETKPTSKSSQGKSVANKADNEEESEASKRLKARKELRESKKLK